MATNHSGYQPDSRCGTSAYRDTLGEIIVALIQAVAAPRAEPGSASGSARRREQSTARSGSSMTTRCTILVSSAVK